MRGKAGPLRVLVVDDERLFGQLGAGILESLGGMETAQAENGQEGLELAWSWRPDVILLDLVMPVMSGMELLRQYRQEGGRAKVVVLTGAELGKVQGRAFALGADYVLGKPVNWRDVVEQISLMAGGLGERCRSLLRELGAREESRGFHQAAECAALLGERECSLLKEAYVEVARRHRTGPESVAKNVERLAKDLHKRGTPCYRRLTGRGEKDPPLTSREFLDLLSQAARIPL